MLAADEASALREDITGVTEHIGQVHFPSLTADAPALAFQVGFPRLELVLEGEVQEHSLASPGDVLKKFDVLFVAADGWNMPEWGKPAKTLSILFGKQQIGFSTQTWDGKVLISNARFAVPRRGPRVGSYLLQALNEIAEQSDKQKTAQYIVSALLSHCIDLLQTRMHTGSRSKALFDAIRDFIEKNHHHALTRESVASAFYISPNYLSHLFQKTGKVGFNEYLIYVRLEHAKELLKRYNLKIKEISVQCGFLDSNYFCRVFRKATARTPSEYRRQYHSQRINEG